MTERLDPVRAWRLLHPKLKEQLGAAAVALGVADLGISMARHDEVADAFDAVSVEAGLLISAIAREHVLHHDILPDGIDLGPLGIQQCRVCGCTDNHACEMGCAWVEVDLCSACVPGRVG